MTIPRIHSIDLVKVLAMLLVINSHMAVLYGNMAMLATGGAIGYACFFFCAGYLMQRKLSVRSQIGRPAALLPFIGNRIWRIYPTVWLWTAILCLALNWPFSIWLLVDGDCWFVGCIMVYFVLLWLLQRYMPRQLQWVALATFLVSVAGYFVSVPMDDSIYGNCWLKSVFFFLPMIYGYGVAVKEERRVMSPEPVEAKRKTFSRMLILFVISISAYYALAAFKYSDAWGFMQLLSIPALLAVIFCIWQVCNADDLKPIASSRLVRWLSGIGLEAYIIQWSIITICYRLDPAYGWLMAWLLILVLASLFNILVKWVRLIFNYIF